MYILNEPSRSWNDMDTRLRRLLTTSLILPWPWKLWFPRPVITLTDFIGYLLSALFAISFASAHAPAIARSKKSVQLNAIEGEPWEKLSNDK